MSSTVRQYGFIAALLKPLTSDEREEVNENLWSEKSNLSVTYDGALLYLDYNANKSMRIREDFYGLTLGNQNFDETEFVEEAIRRGLDVDGNTITTYNCIYYNGGDSPLDMLTKDDFLSGKTGEQA
jgi:hypothetical protein